MKTKFEKIEDTELIQEIMSGFSETVKKHFERESITGYRLINVNKKIVANTLKEKDLEGSLYYYDYDCGFKELTEEILNSDEFKSIYMRNNSLVSGVYITTHEAFKFVLGQIKK